MRGGGGGVVQGVPTLPELKLTYYQHMVRYYSHYNNYLEITRCFRAVYEAETVQADPAAWATVRAASCCRFALGVRARPAAVAFHRDEELGTL